MGGPGGLLRAGVGAGAGVSAAAHRGLAPVGSSLMHGMSDVMI